MLDKQIKLRLALETLTTNGRDLYIKDGDERASAYMIFQDNAFRFYSIMVEIFEEIEQLKNRPSSTDWHEDIMDSLYDLQAGVNSYDDGVDELRRDLDEGINGINEQIKELKETIGGKKEQPKVDHERLLTEEDFDYIQKLAEHQKKKNRGEIL